MKLACEEHDRLVVVAIKGELVREQLTRFQEEVTARIPDRARDVVMDLSQTDFIDSDGLETMLNLQSLCADHLGQVRLAACHDNVTQILHVTRLNRRFDYHDSVDDAIKSLR
jgi:anti-sigma B factor antagonist